MDFTGFFQTGYTSAFDVRMTTGGSNITGFKIGSYVRLDNTIGNSDIVYADFIGQVMIAYSNKNAGTHGLYAGESLAFADNGATHEHVVGHNANIAIHPSASVTISSAVRAQKTKTGRGSTTDAAFSIMYTEIGNQGFSTGILLNEYSGDQSIAATGDIMKSFSALTVANVLNLPNVTVTGNILNFPHAVLTGAGALTLDGALVLNSTLKYGGVTLTAAVTGTGKMVLDTGPTLSAPVLGTPASGVLTNCTGLPYTSLVSAIYGTFYLSSGQSYTATAAAKVNIDTAETSQGLTFDGVTNHRVTIITAGRYLIMCSVYITGVTAGDELTGRIKKNGTTDLVIGIVAAATSTAEGAAITSKIVSLAASDYLEVFATSPHNGTIGGAASLTFLSLHYIGP